MVNAWDPISALNLVFCIIIVLLGTWGYTKKKNLMALYIGLSFGLFGLSHFAVLIGADSSAVTLLILRSLGYLVVIFTLFKTVFLDK
ncbi:MAG: hypothetical protein ACP5C3_09025 [Methanomicrobiales archaeon]